MTRSQTRFDPRRTTATCLVAGAFLAALMPCARAGQRLAPGDLVAVGAVRSSSGAQTLGIVRIEPASGQQTLLREGVLGYRYVAVDSDGVLYGSAGAGPGARIDRLDLATGELVTLSRGEHLWRPNGIVVDAAGDLLVTDAGKYMFPPSDAALLRVDARTGAQTVLAQDAFLARPKDLALDGDGSVLVVDDTWSGALFRYDPRSGQVTVVSLQRQDSLLAQAYHVGVAPGGTIFTNGPWWGGLVRVDAATGRQALAQQGVRDVRSLERSLEGDLLVAQEDGTVWRFDPVREVLVGTVTSNGLLATILAMAVVPAPIERQE